ncbi:MAG: hypothetical protein K2Y21_00300 [Phycisphaerales bacterium]|nr:hypothetical protein [Phycisphaerales bacterium]
MALLGTATLALSSCGVFGSSVTRDATLASFDSGTVLTLEPKFQAYYAADPNTADFYLSDLPAEAFADNADLSRFSGSLVHVHMFLAPKAGATPIAFSANSVTVRHLIIAEGQMGQYSGGGFLLPSGTAGDSTFGGRLKDATMRLTARTPGFVDRLGACEFESGLAVPKDVSRAKRMALLLERAGELMVIKTRPKILGKDQDEAVPETPVEEKPVEPTVVPAPGAEAKKNSAAPAKEPPKP